MQEILDTIARLIEERTREAEEMAAVEARAELLAEVLEIAGEFKDGCSCARRIHEKVRALSPTLPEAKP